MPEAGAQACDVHDDAWVQQQGRAHPLRPRPHPSRRFELLSHLDRVHSSTRAGRCVNLVAVTPNRAVSPEPRPADATMDAFPMLISVAKRVASTPCSDSQMALCLLPLSGNERDVQ